jgi:hypothetical protein
MICLKLLWVLRSIGIKRATQAVLGADAYRRIFQQAPTMTNESTGETVVNVMRIIKGQVVGRSLAASEGGKAVATQDPCLCQHPEGEMVARGNRTDKWWTCKLCLSRWERTGLPTAPTGNPKASEVMTIGRQMGKTFDVIFQQEKEYCQWVLQSVEAQELQEPQYHRLAHYIVGREQEVAWTNAMVPEELGSETDL